MRIVFVFSINWSEAGSSRDMGARWSGYVIFVDIFQQNCVVGVGWKREIFCHY